MNAHVMAKLKNGAEEVKGLVADFMKLVTSLHTDNPVTFRELVMLARDSTHQISEGVDGTRGKLLKDMMLIYLDTGKKPHVHGVVRNIILSAVTGDGMDMELGDPIKKEGASVTAEEILRAILKCVDERIELEEDKRKFPEDDHDVFHEAIAEADKKALEAIQTLLPKEDKT